MDVPVADPASIISPVNFLPIFLLIFQKNYLVIKIFPGFNDNLRTVRGNASEVETFKSVGNVSNSVGFRIGVFGHDPGFKVIAVFWQQVNAAPGQLTQDLFRRVIPFAEISQFGVLILKRQFDQVLVNLESNSTDQ
jgi:hypothetical protein